MQTKVRSVGGYLEVTVEFDTGVRVELGLLDEYECAMLAEKLEEAADELRRF